MAVQSFVCWLLVIEAPGCADGIKSRDGISAAAVANGPARRVAETDDAAMVDDVAKAKTVYRALV